MVHIEENGQIYCGQDVQSMFVCDFLGNYSINQECGNCPLSTFGRKFIEVAFDMSFKELMEGEIEAPKSSEENVLK